MSVYRKKAEFVEAWQVRVGHPVPDWLWTEIKRGTASAPTHVRALINQWGALGVDVACDDGVNRRAECGDWIVKTHAGLKVVGQLRFLADYETPPMGRQTGDASTLANEAEYDAVQDAANNAAKTESALDQALEIAAHLLAEGFTDVATDDEPGLDERRRLTAMQLAVAIGDLHTGASAVARAKEIEAYLRGDE